MKNKERDYLKEIESIERELGTKEITAEIKRFIHKTYDSSDYELIDSKLKILYNISQQITYLTDFDKLLNEILTSALSIIDASTGIIFLYTDKKSKELKIASSVGILNVEDNLISFSRTIVNETLESNKTIFLPDARKSIQSAKSRSIKDLSIFSVIAVPLRIDGGKNIIGVLYVDNRETANTFSKEDVSFLEAFAGFSALVIYNAKLIKELQDENKLLKAEVEKYSKYDGIVGKSEAMQKVFKMLDAIIPTEAPVLIEGETGTGKEIIARVIHLNGPRKEYPFVAVDCGALPETLLESELFGHTRGAFTGAVSERKGLFETANGGTLFLDEISNTSLSFQVKLLRVLQDGEFRRLGDSNTRRADVRIIAATNVNLEKEVKSGRFREDLFYRLDVLRIFLPPLRERKEDIPLLVDHFLKKYSEKYKKNVKGVSSEVMEIFQKYDWNGNIRELENAIEQGITFCKSDLITINEIPKRIIEKTIEEQEEQDSSIDNVIKKHILKILQSVNWNRSKAAKILNVHRNTLTRWINDLKISKSD